MAMSSKAFNVGGGKAIGGGIGEQVLELGEEIWCINRQGRQRGTGLTQQVAQGDVILNGFHAEVGLDSNGNCLKNGAAPMFTTLAARVSAHLGVKTLNDQAVFVML